MRNDLISGFGDRLKLIRHHYLLTPKIFGEKLRITKNWVSKLESGTKSPSNSLILLICLIYHVNENWLLTGEGEMFTKDQAVIGEETPEYQLPERLQALIQGLKTI